MSINDASIIIDFKIINIQSYHMTSCAGIILIESVVLVTP